MKRVVASGTGGLFLASLCFWTVASAQAQTKEERQFMKEHQKDMTTLMEKCSQCHSLQRALQKKSKEEWDKALKIMAGKPHAGISQEEQQRIRKWIDFMHSATMPGP